MVAAFRLAVLLALAAIFAVGCGTTSENTGPPTSRDGSATTSTLAPAPDGDVNDDTSTDENATSADSDNEPLSDSDTESDTDSENGSDDLDAPTTTQIDDEFRPSTTANPTDEKAIDEAGNEIVEAWWTPIEPLTYSELADSLLADSLITEQLADEWRAQGDQSVIAAPEDTRIIKMWPVRVAEDNATFQISALAEGEEQETLTFIEFEIEDGTWKATGIE